MTRRFVPFGRFWTLRMPVPYSALVRDGDRAWSSGQLPLDETGAVRSGGDILGQADVIADNLTATLEEAGLEPGDISRLVLYSAAHNPGDEAGVAARFADRFGKEALIETIPVPHFFYDGVLLEVDAYCAPSDPVIGIDLPGGGQARVKREGDLTLVNLTAPPAALGRAIGELLARYSLSPDQLLSGWGIAPEPQLSSAPGQVAPRLPGFFSGALMPCYSLDVRAHLYLTFGAGEVAITERRGEKVRLHLARTGTLAVLDARYRGGRSIGIEAQTQAVMDDIAMVLDEHAMSFADVVKSTTFYAGGNSAEELHGNLTIRNGFFNAPGPASTGVPISRMADPGSKVRIELVLRPAAAL